MSSVIVGYDGSPTARMAVQEAAALATGLARPLHVVWVVDEKATHADVANVWTLDHLDDQLADRNLAIAKAASDHLHELTAELPGEVTSAAVGGTPAKVLVAEAERLGASVIVVGNKNTQGLRRVLGGVATDVVHHAPCNVYVVKTT